MGGGRQRRRRRRRRRESLIKDLKRQHSADGRERAREKSINK